MLTFLLSLIHHTCLKRKKTKTTTTKRINKKPQNNLHTDLVNEVHILLSTFIILQKVQRIVICVLK